MRTSHVISLIQNNYNTVRIAYQPEDDAKTYTFKAHKNFDLKVGDLVVVPSQFGKFGYSIVEVKVVDPTPNIDTSAPFDYAWVVAKVDFSLYNSLTAIEAKFAETIRNLERQRAQNAALTEFYSAFPEDSEERKQLESLITETRQLSQGDSNDTSTT